MVGMPEAGVFVPVDVSTQNLMGGTSSLVVQSEKITESETDDKPWTRVDYLIATVMTIILFPVILILSILVGCDKKKIRRFYDSF